MKITLPNAPAGWAAEALMRITRAFAGVVGKDEAVPHFHLRSANGKIYKVVVDDDGTLRTVYVSG